MRTVVFVDGYNLYYGLLKGSPYKWLNLHDLFAKHVLSPDTDVVQVRYYTAPVLGRMSDDPESPQRQRLYLQALRKSLGDKIAIVEGRIQASEPFQRLVKPIAEAPHLRKVQVFDFNEKQSDVNLATDLLCGAWLREFEQAVLCSNDTDLVGALAAVKRHHPGIRLGVAAPIPGSDHRKIAGGLVQHSDWQKTISPVHLASAQLPDHIPHTSIRKPEAWA